ncbi:MAG: hypothetical protein GF349_04255 [Candidatus Magasanikbacteria bacterium]|nr:hypothetical protein [Candidatus Magasanikbacteria bacterium]
MTMSFEFRKLTEEEAQQYRKYYFTEVFPDFEAVSEIYADLKEKLSDDTGRNIGDYHPVFWELYVYSTWFLLERLSAVELKQALTNQVVDAIRMNINVQNSFLEYFTLNIMEPDDMESIYADIKKNILNASAIIGMDKETGEKMSLSDAVSFLERFVGTSDSLQYVEFKTKLKDVMYSDYKVNDYTYIDPEVAVTRLINLINFFIATTADDFIRAVYYYNKPLLLQEKEEMLLQGEQSEGGEINLNEEKEPETEKTEDGGVAQKTMPNSNISPPKKEETKKPSTKKMNPKERKLPKEQKQSDPQKNNPKIEILSATGQQSKKQEKTEPSEDNNKQTGKKMTPTEIKNAINSRFSKDKSGNYSNIEGVLMFLGNLAEEYNDPSIAELYYFDENSGGFKWNQDLLK